MIVAKQLDLPDGPDVPVALPLPRTQLARELEKYSRPKSTSAAAESAAPPAAETPPVRLAIRHEEFSQHT